MTPSPSKPHVVYVIGQDGGPWKVGVTRSLAGRLGALQGSHPTRLVAAHVVLVCGSRAELVEQHAHAQLSEYRMQGEWFAAPLSVVVAAVDRSNTIHGRTPSELMAAPSAPVVATVRQRSAKAILKAELTRRGVSYRELAERLGETEQSVNKKINRGEFSAQWFLRCLELIGAHTLRLDD